jgi:peptidyl-prolyl cis-trans isomerase B (cyclophilin B)
VATGKRQQRESREARERLRRYEARQELHRTQVRRRLRDNIVAAIGVLVVAALAGVTQVVYFTSGPGAPTPEPSASATPDAGQNVGAPSPDLSEYRDWTGEITFNDAVVGVTLNGELAPQAVAGFVQDVDNAYYPGKTCHRLAADRSFLQCGSIDGLGGPDPAFSYGPVENAPADNVYPAGSIAMARQGDNGYSQGHQFFIVLTDTQLGSDTAGGYSIVGTVTSGLEQLQALVAGGVDPATAGPDGSGNPLTPVTITNFTLQ